MSDAPSWQPIETAPEFDRVTQALREKIEALPVIDDSETADGWNAAIERVLAILDAHQPAPDAVAEADAFDAFAQARKISARQVARLRNVLEAQRQSATDPISETAADWVLVPAEATVEMLAAWYRYKNGHHFHDDPPPTDTSDVGAYRAMIAAAPKFAKGTRP